LKKKAALLLSERSRANNPTKLQTNVNKKISFMSMHSSIITL